MPLYTFLNKDTNEEFDKRMSYDDLQTYLEENKNIEQVFKITVADSVSLGITQPPVDFKKYVLNKVKEMPGANKDKIEKRWTIPKEV